MQDNFHFYIMWLLYVDLLGGQNRYKLGSAIKINQPWNCQVMAKLNTNCKHRCTAVLSVNPRLPIKKRNGKLVIHQKVS